MRIREDIYRGFDGNGRPTRYADVLKELWDRHEDDFTTQELADATGLDDGFVRRYLNELLERNFLLKDGPLWCINEMYDAQNEHNEMATLASFCMDFPEIGEMETIDFETDGTVEDQELYCTFNGMTDGVHGYVDGEISPSSSKHPDNEVERRRLEDINPYLQVSKMTEVTSQELYYHFTSQRQSFEWDFNEAVRSYESIRPVLPPEIEPEPIEKMVEALPVNDYLKVSMQLDTA